MGPAIIWFRTDLRLADNPALWAAIAAAGSSASGVIPLFVWAPDDSLPIPMGAASRVWLRDSLRALDAALRSKGSRLVLRAGPVLEALLSVVEESGATGVYWNSTVDPWISARDARLAEILRARGVRTPADAAVTPADVLFDPRSFKDDGEPFTTLAPFWRACLLASAPTRPLPAPAVLVSPNRWPASATVSDLASRSQILPHAGVADGWEPGETGATSRLFTFVENKLAGYARLRHRLAAGATSRLSPHLRFGEIGPRQVWHGARDAAARRRLDPMPFLKEIVRRDFARYLLHHFPRTFAEPMHPAFAHFPWRQDPSGFDSWKRGLTGYPLVDAGMRELSATGFIHGPARMVAASFLVKQLLVCWREGARWFWEAQFDADLAANAAGWQSCVGSASPAAPQFRFLSPEAHGARYDADGAYVRCWVPELGRLSARFIHAPWTAPDKTLSNAGVTLGRSYPWPIVDARAARVRSLAAFEAMRVAARAAS